MFSDFSCILHLISYKWLPFALIFLHCTRSQCFLLVFLRCFVIVKVWGFTHVLKFLLSCFLCQFTHFSLHTVAVCPALISFTCALLTCSPLSLLIVFPRVPLSWHFAVFQVLFRGFHAYFPACFSGLHCHVGIVQLLGLLLLVWVIYLPSHTVSLLFVYIELCL